MDYTMVIHRLKHHPQRFWIAAGFVAFSFILYGLIFTVAVIPGKISQKAVAIAVLYVLSQFAWVCGIIIGKEFLDPYLTRLGLKKKKHPS